MLLDGWNSMEVRIPHKAQKVWRNLVNLSAVLSPPLFPSGLNKINNQRNGRSSCSLWMHSFTGSCIPACLTVIFDFFICLLPTYTRRFTTSPLLGLLSVRFGKSLHHTKWLIHWLGLALMLQYGKRVAIYFRDKSELRVRLWVSNNPKGFSKLFGAERRKCKM